MKTKLVSILAAFTLTLTGCATDGTTDLNTPTGSLPVPAGALNTALTAANILQQFNTGLTASLPTVTQVLNATHNSGDVGIAQNVVIGSNLISALVAAFANTVKASQASGASPSQTQAAANAVLAPSSVAAITANVVASTPSSN